MTFSTRLLGTIEFHCGFVVIKVFLFLDCYDLERNGYRYFEVVVRDEFNARDITECSQRCLQQEYCKSFAYRDFGIAANNPNSNFYLSSSADNCQLTALEVDKALSTDLISDPVWNIYQRRLNSGFCDGSNNGGGGGGGILNPSGKKR